MRTETSWTLQHYRDFGVHPGGFLVAVLENDMRTAFGRADDNSRAELPEIIEWCNRELFWDAWGSKNAVAAWMRGKQRQREAAEAFNEAMGAP